MERDLEKERERQTERDSLDLWLPRLAKATLARLRSWICALMSLSEAWKRQTSPDWLDAVQNFPWIPCTYRTWDISYSYRFSSIGKRDQQPHRICNDCFYFCPSVFLRLHRISSLYLWDSLRLEGSQVERGRGRLDLIHHQRKWDFLLQLNSLQYSPGARYSVQMASTRRTTSRLWTFLSSCTASQNLSLQKYIQLVTMRERYKS